MTRRRVETVAPIGLTLRMQRGVSTPAAPLSRWAAPTIGRSVITADAITVQRSADLGLRIRLPRPAVSAAGCALAWDWQWLCVEAAIERYDGEGAQRYQRTQVRVHGVPGWQVGRVAHTGQVGAVSAAAVGDHTSVELVNPDFGAWWAVLVAIPAAVVPVGSVAVDVRAYHAPTTDYPLGLAGMLAPSLRPALGVWAWTDSEPPAVEPVLDVGWTPPHDLPAGWGTSLALGRRRWGQPGVTVLGGALGVMPAAPPRWSAYRALDLGTHPDPSSLAYASLEAYCHEDPAVVLDQAVQVAAAQIDAACG